MNKAHHQSWLHTLLSSTLMLSVILLAACESGTVTNSPGPNTANGGKGCTKVGILLPETASSVRWETKDHPLLVQAVRAAIPNVQIDYNNADGNSDTQLG